MGNVITGHETTTVGALNQFPSESTTWKEDVGLTPVLHGDTQLSIPTSRLTSQFFRSFPNIKELELFIDDNWMTIHRVTEEVKLHPSTLEDEPIVDTYLPHLRFLTLHIGGDRGSHNRLSTPTALVEWMPNLKIFDVRDIGLTGNLSVVYAMLENTEVESTKLILQMRQLHWLWGVNQQIIDNIKSLDVTIESHDDVQDDTVRLLEDWTFSRSLTTDISSLCIHMKRMTKEIQNTFASSRATHVEYPHDKGLAEFWLIVEVDDVHELSPDPNPSWNQFVSIHTKTVLDVKLEPFPTNGAFVWFKNLLVPIAARSKSVHTQLSMPCWVDAWTTHVKRNIDELLTYHVQLMNNVVQKFIRYNQPSTRHIISPEIALQNMGVERVFLLHVTIEMFSESTQNITYHHHLSDPALDELRNLLFEYGILAVEIANTVAPAMKRQRMSF